MLIRYALVCFSLIMWGCEPVSDDDAQPAASATGSGGTAGEGGVAMGGTAGEGGVAMGGTAGEGGVAMGGTAGEGGVAMGGTAGEGGTAGVTERNDCTDAGGICREGQECETDESRIRSSCGMSDASCCVAGNCNDADQDGICDREDPHCSLDDAPLACDALIPPCPEYEVPETSDGCYTGQCVTWADCGTTRPGCDDVDQDGICDREDPYCSLDDIQISCRSLPPQCPENQVPETSEGCYTGQCVTWEECGTGTLSCTTSTECPNGYRCDAGGCLPCPGGNCGNGPIQCGGFAGLQCPDTMICIDDPSDACDPMSGGADCMGLCAESCEVGSDQCGTEQWCRETENSRVAVCVDFAQDGEDCGGFRPAFAQKRCAPDLSCASINQMIPDLPGVCLKRCNAGSPCPDNEYCSEDNVCRADGSCINNADCANGDNGYRRAACAGRGLCMELGNGFELSCTWNCD